MPSLSAARALSDALTRYLGRALARAELAAELRRIAMLLDENTATTAARKADAKATQSASVRTVFEHWIRATGRNPKTTKLTADRRQKVEARLREGYSVDDLKRAVDGCAASDFHRGDNDTGKRHDDLTLICRSGSKVEGFRDAAPEPDTNTTKNDEQLDHRSLQAASAEALRNGDMDAYNRAQARLRSLR